MYKKKRAGDPPADLDEGRKRVVLFRLTLVYNFKFRERERECVRETESLNEEILFTLSML